VVGLASAFVAFVTPVQIGLLEITSDALLAVSLLVDFVFLVDLILQFFVMVHVPTPRGVQREVRLYKIALHYSRSWLLIDLVAVIPWDLIGLTADARGTKIIRGLWTLKMLRLVKPSRIIHKIDIPFYVPYQQQLVLFRFLGFLLVICHWLSCVWAMTLQLVDEEYPRWFDDIEAADSSFGFEASSSFRVYIAAFYFCSYTMTSVGYGDLGPQNVLERVFCTFMVVLSGLCWAYVLGEVCGIVADINAEHQAFRQRMHHLNMMMQDEHLPHELQSRLREFFVHNRDQARHLTHQSLLDAMSPQLKAEVSSVVNFPWLEKVTFFNRFVRKIEELEAAGMSVAPYHACIADISRQLKSMAYAQSEYLSSIQVLSILSKGLVLRRSRLEHKGAVWGEDFVLSDSSLVRPVSAYALTYLEVLCLARDDFMEVVTRHKMTCPMLTTIVRSFCVRLAVRRGILAEARCRMLTRRSVRSTGRFSL